MKRICALVCLILAGGPLPGGELADVVPSDAVRVGDHALQLNGLGLRKKAFIKVYVAGLYLPQRESDAGVILSVDGPRRMEMVFKFGVGADKMCDAWLEGLEANIPEASSEVRSQFETLCGYMEDLDKGDRMIITYLPKSGTEIEVKGRSRGLLPGKPFADALFSCWLGPEPPSEDFKAGLLGQ